MKFRHNALKEILRNKFGDSIAEFGPALFVILMFLFFPMLNMVSIGVSYGLGMVLNYNQVHEAALLPSADALSSSGPIKKNIPEQWQAGMGQFAKLSGSPITNIAYRDGTTGLGSGAGQSDTTDKIVKVQTTITCNPFLPIPLPIANIPGVNGPMTFTLASEALMENPDNAGSTVAIAADDDTKPPIAPFRPPVVGPSDDDTKPPIPPITRRPPWFWGFFGGLGGCNAR